jgi:hypothetical protein
MDSAMINNPTALGGRFSKQSTAQKTTQKKKKQPKPKKKKNVIKEKAIAHDVLQDLVARLSSRLPKSMVGPACSGQPFGNYLKSLINPRDYAGVRLPDQKYQVDTATYQSKFDFVVTGVPVNAATTASGNSGRFCYIFQPKLSQSDATGFSASINPYSVIYQDGPASTTPATQDWSPFMLAADNTTNFVKVLQDAEVASIMDPSVGAAENIRPVSMAVLASFSGNLTQGAGDIAIQLMSPSSYSKLACNSSLTNQTGICGWEGLASKVPKTYRGPLTKGAFCWWHPWSEGDEELRPSLTTDTNSHQNWEYPYIIVSGHNGNVNTVAPECLSLQCWINYEYTTENKLISTLPSPVPSGETTLAQQILRDQPVSMPNDFHDKFFQAIVGALAGFVAGGPVGAALGGAAGYFGSNLIGSAIGKR